LAGTKKIFEGLGPGTLIPQRGKLAMKDPEILRTLAEREGFVLSRVDGQTSLEEICLLVPFDEPTTMVILRRLWELGAIEVPGVARQIVLPVQPPVPANDFDKAPTSGLKRRPDSIMDNLEALAPPIGTPEPPPKVTTEEGPISAAVMQRIDSFYTTLDQRNAFEMLEISRDADDKAVKRAYFKLSKEFHPDRYFGRDIGEYKDRLSKIFQAVKASFEVLSDKRRREAYMDSLGQK
jgi:hypothetical protein